MIAFYCSFAATARLIQDSFESIQVADCLHRESLCLPNDGVSYAPEDRTSLDPSGHLLFLRLNVVQYVKCFAKSPHWYIPHPSKRNDQTHECPQLFSKNNSYLTKTHKHFTSASNFLKSTRELLSVPVAQSQMMKGAQVKR